MHFDTILVILLFTVAIVEMSQLYLLLSQLLLLLLMLMLGPSDVWFFCVAAVFVFVSKLAYFLSPLSRNYIIKTFYSCERSFNEITWTCKNFALVKFGFVAPMRCFMTF